MITAIMPTPTIMDAAGALTLTFAGLKDGATFVVPLHQAVQVAATMVIFQVLKVE